jgi:hypothetical protein
MIFFLKLGMSHAVDKTMKLYFFIYTLIAGVLLFSDLSLGKSPKDQSVTTLGEIRRLVGISQDLNDHTAVLIKDNSKMAFDNKNCNCTCRDDTWACTDTNCSLHGDTCHQQVTQRENGLRLDNTEEFR